MEGQTSIFSQKVTKILFHSYLTPIILLLTVLALLFVLFRMKSIEQDYKYNDFHHKIENALYENKELKAKKAKLLSVDNLRKMARKFVLEQPKENQIIIVP